MYRLPLLHLLLKEEHAISKEPTRVKCPDIKPKACLTNARPFDGCWSDSSPETSKPVKAAHSMGEKNCNLDDNMEDLREGIRGFKVSQLPPLDLHRGYSQYTIHLNKNRSKMCNESNCILSLQQKQKGFSSYSDPLCGARLEYLQRIAEIANLESETVRQEKMKKLKALKRD